MHGAVDDFMKTRPKVDFITARAGVDDSFGRGVKPSSSIASAKEMRWA